MMPPAIRIECYAGYRGEETPRRFTLDNRCIEIEQVIDRWMAPDHRYFKVIGDDGQPYILRHDRDTQQWEHRVPTVKVRSERYWQCNRDGFTAVRKTGS